MARRVAAVRRGPRPVPTLAGTPARGQTHRTQPPRPFGHLAAGQRTDGAGTPAGVDGHSVAVAIAAASQTDRPGGPARSAPRLGLGETREGAAGPSAAAAHCA